jgi:hypothetical protein
MRTYLSTLAAILTAVAVLVGVLVLLVVFSDSPFGL